MKSCFKIQANYFLLCAFFLFTVSNLIKPNILFQHIIFFQLIMKQLRHFLTVIGFQVLSLLFFNYKYKMLQTSQTNIRRQQIVLELQPASSQYKPTNAYTHKPALEQILALFLFVTIVTLHAVFITTATVKLQSPILWVLVAVTYVLLLIMIYDYMYITCNDPVDDLILKVQKKYKEQELIQCFDCKIKVHQKSHHCQTCHRCVQKFDHHCKYLNNCIGGKNYSQFIRLLITITFFCIAILCSGIWVFIAAKIDQNYNSSIISQWGALAAFILAIIILAAVDSLLFFHFYLIFWLKMTTYEYIKKGWQEQQREQEQLRRKAIQQQKLRVLQQRRN